MKWLWIAGLVATVFLAAEVGYRIHRKRKARILLARRTNPTREEFLALMDSDADPAVADFMWDTIVFYTAPQVLPHPEDDLLTDYAIDDGDIAEDWLPDFAKSRGLNWKDWPDWPVGWPPTVRNFARWLQSGIPPDA